MTEKYKIEKKVESILGLLLGLLVFVFFFIKEQYALNLYYKGSIVMNNLYPLIDNIFFGDKPYISYLHPMRTAAVMNYAKITWWI
jgi:hypothetical protein